MRRLRLTPLRLAAALAAGSLVFASVAYAASLGISTDQLHAWSQTLTKGSCNQTSATTYDTYVDEQSPSNGFGSATTLSIDGNSGKYQYAFIRFDLSGCNLPTTAGADGATLTLTVMSAGKDTISLFPVYSSWDPGTLTYSGVSGLTVGSTATTSFTPTASGTFALTVTSDVDAAIKAGSLWGWELRDTSGNKTTTIGSSENGHASNQPSLTLAYEK